MTKPTFICCKDFLLLFKEETVRLCWAVLASLLTESQIYLTLSYFLLYTSVLTSILSLIIIYKHKNLIKLVISSPKNNQKHNIHYTAYT